MRTALLPMQFMASCLSILLLSCSATRPTHSSLEAHELSRSVLVIQEEPGTQISHSWIPVSSFDLAKYPHRAISSGTYSLIVRAAWTRNCEDELDACIAMCLKSLTGPDWSHASQGSKTKICRDRCRPAYTDCSRLREQAEALSFPVMDEAVKWLKRHREELQVGAVVVIAGAAFVVIAAGSGGAALILAPAVLLVSAEDSPTPSVAAAQP
jgi:hypothetical protein